MPIKPENKNLYPGDWGEIRERIKERAGNRCEKCGVNNHAIGYRDKTGIFHEIEHSHQGDQDATDARSEGFKVIQIVCTTAHLNHSPADCRDENLAFWCQKCHNTYDAPHRAETMRAKRNAKRVKNNLKLEL